MMSTPDTLSRALRKASTLGLVLLALAWFAPRPARAQFDVLARQVTVFGVLATPKGTTIDPKLDPIKDQLEKLLPKHGFKLLRVESKRLSTGQILDCELGSGFRASAQLIQAVDPDGKIQVHVKLQRMGTLQYQGLMATPPNQIFFCDKELPNGERLVIGVGAR
ncbi:MAG: hypothetical protein SFX72_16745 [Isosphaeraceae bacterium]|nr:hypothetical protein [Isosphaeraceae bacterium]